MIPCWPREKQFNPRGPVHKGKKIQKPETEIVFNHQFTGTCATPFEDCTA
jgi:hypothetical protein